MANSKIRGITIEIGGDTTKLGKALAGSEKQTRSLQVELKEIEKLLKFDPTNTELLAQKQKVLGDMISETSKKLDTMKEAEAQVVAQFEKGEIGEDQLRAFQREIMKTEQTLGDMKEELKTATRNLEEFGDNNGVAKEEADKFERATQEAKDALEAEKKALKDAEKAQKDHEKAVADAKKEVEEFGDKVKDAGEKVGKGILAIGTATVAGGGYALKLSTEFDQAFNILQARTGATSEEMDGLNEAMENVYKNNFGESIEEVANAMAKVRDVTGEMDPSNLQSMTESAITLEDTFDMDMTETLRGVNALMDHFGLSSEEAFDLIASGAQNGLNYTDELGDNVSEYAGKFAEAGYSSEEYFQLLKNGAEGGAYNLDKVNDSINEVTTRLADGTIEESLGMFSTNTQDVFKAWQDGEATQKEVIDSIVTDIKNTTSEQDKMNLSAKAFGTMAEDGGTQFIEALSSVGDSFDNVKGKMDEVKETRYDDIGSALQGLGRTIETDVVKPLGDDLKPVVEDAIEYVKENAPTIKDTISQIVTKVGEFVGFIVNNGSTIISIIATIGAGFVTWKVASIISGLVTAITALSTAIKGGTTAMQALNLVMKANPAMIIASLLAMLVTWLVTFIATNEEVRAKFVEIWEKIKEVAGTVVDAVVGFFKGIVDFFQNNWQMILTFMLNPFAGAFALLYEKCEGFRNFVDGLVTAIQEFFSKLGSSIAETFSLAWAKVIEVFSPAIEWFSALFSSVYETLSSIVEVIIVLLQGCWEIIKAVFKVVKDWFTKTVLDPVKNAFSKTWTAISSLASTCWSKIKSVFSVVTSWFNSTIITPVTKVFSTMWGKLSTGASDAWKAIKKVFSNLTSWFRDKFTEAWTAVKNVFSTGGKIFTGITEGITAMFKTVVNAIIGGLNKVVAVPFNAINKALDKIRGASIAGITPFKGLPTISVPVIPKLAKGGILKRGQLGLLEGDGSEAVVPLEKNTEWTRNVAKQMSEYQEQQRASTNSALLGRLNDIYNRLDKLNQSIVLDTGVLVGATIDQIDNRLGVNLTRKARGI